MPCEWECKENAANERGKRIKTYVESWCCRSKWFGNVGADDCVNTWKWVVVLNTQHKWNFGNGGERWRRANWRRACDGEGRRVACLCRSIRRKCGKLSHEWYVWCIEKSSVLYVTSTFCPSLENDTSHNLHLLTCIYFACTCYYIYLFIFILWLGMIVCTVNGITCMMFIYWKWTVYNVEAASLR